MANKRYAQAAGPVRRPSAATGSSELPMKPGIANPVMPGKTQPKSRAGGVPCCPTHPKSIGLS